MTITHKVTIALIVCLTVPTAVVSACTAFLATGDDGVLFGNNEDFWNPATRMWFVPGGEGRYGAVYFGFDDLSPQGGMNEAGLAFDGFATRPKPVTGSADKPAFEGDLMSTVMTECATVDEVIELLSGYNLAMMERFMMMFADATGDAVIIEGDKILRKNGAFQVVTNFYQSEDPAGQNAYGAGKACARFEIANEMLAGFERVGIEEARQVLNAVHAEGRSRTLYSNIYDLDDRLVYVYNFHDFENVVTIDLAEELAEGPHTVDLPSLFPRNFAREAFVAKQREAMEERREQRTAVELPAETLERYVGTYSSAFGEIAIKLEDGALVVTTPALQPIRLTPTSDTEFFEVTLMMDYEVGFRLDEDGSTDGADIKGTREDITLFEQFVRRVD